MITARRRLLSACALVLAVIVSAVPLPAQEPVKIRIGNLGFPSHAAMIIGVLKEKGFDKKNGVDMDVKVFGAVGA